MSFYLVLYSVFLAFFTRGLKCGHVVDDVVRIKHMDILRKNFKEFKNQRWFYSLYYLRAGTYGAGLFPSPVLDHGFSLLVHLCSCLLICSIVGSEVGFLASLLYMLNPVNNQVTLWLNGRRYSLTILLTLLAWKMGIFGVFLFPAMAWLHVSGIAFPLLYASTPHWWLIPVCALVGVFCGFKRIRDVLVFRKSEFIDPKKDKNECQKLTWKKAILYVKSVGWYVYHILFPNKPRMFHEFLYYFSRYPNQIRKGYSLDASFFVGFVTLSYLIYEVFSGRPESFWAFWFLLFVSQWCNVYTVTMHVADRYCSLPAVGLMVLLAYKLQWLYSFNPIVALLFLGALFSFYYVKYAPLFGAYKTYGNFLRYHIAIEPSGVEARQVMALNYINSDKPDLMSAYAVVKDGLIYRPMDFKLLILMAQIMFSVGKIENGLVLLNKAQSVCPLGDEEDCAREFDGLRKHFTQVLLEESKTRKNQKVAREQAENFSMKY